MKIRRFAKLWIEVVIDYVARAGRINLQNIVDRRHGTMQWRPVLDLGKRNFAERVLTIALRETGCDTIFCVEMSRGNYATEIISSDPDAYVFVFEPHPETFIRATKRFCGSGRVQVCPLSFSDQ